MKKNHYRDYATEAFRLLGRTGTAESYKQRVYNDMLRFQQLRESNVHDGISKPTEAAVIRAEQAVRDAAATILDLEAAEYALETIRIVRGPQAERSVRAVYMLMPEQELTRGEIEHRVIAASILISADRRTIYRWLALARRLFAEKRGLRL